MVRPGLLLGAVPGPCAGERNCVVKAWSLRVWEPKSSPTGPAAGPHFHWGGHAFTCPALATESNAVSLWSSTFSPDSTLISLVFHLRMPRLAAL